MKFGSNVVLLARSLVPSYTIWPGRSPDAGISVDWLLQAAATVGGGLVMWSISELRFVGAQVPEPVKMASPAIGLAFRGGRSAPTECINHDEGLGGPSHNSESAIYHFSTKCLTIS